MPDPARKSVSASQVSALWNVSPYMTRWQLWQWFKRGGEVPQEPETTRMFWGKTLQEPILNKVSSEMKLEVYPNATDAYCRNGLIGATRDAVILAPDRGPGCVEVKCIFDYGVWMKDWHGGTQPPRWHEIQLQAGIYAGDGIEPYTWGLLVAWCCGGELVYFERQPNRDLFAKMEIEAGRFFHSIEEGVEPAVFGTESEAKWLTSMYETRKDSYLNMTHDHALADTLAAYASNKQAISHFNDLNDGYRARLMAAAQDHEHVALPDGVGYRIVKSGRGKTIKPYGLESTDDS